MRIAVIAGALLLAAECGASPQSTTGVAGGGGAAGAIAAAGASGAAGVGGAAGAAAGAGGRADTNCAPIVARDPDAFVHPGGLHKRSDLERMRYMVAAGVEPWAASYEKLRADAHASPTYAVRGNPAWTDVECGATHGSEFENDANAAYLNALMWAI